MPVNFVQALLDVLIFWMLTTPHEFAHAWVAERLGDATPRRDGRVPLNPAAHIDVLGTVIVPLVTSLMGGGFIGWGRPVMTNPSKLRGGNWGMTAVAMAGPLSNIVFACIVASAANLLPGAMDILGRAIFMSVYLALFNLIPLPPLDGSKVLLAAGLPVRWYIELSRYGFLLLMVLFYSTGFGRILHDTTVVSANAILHVLFFRG